MTEHYIGTSLNLVFLQGKKWFAWGAFFFIAGLMGSFVKGGQIRRVYRTLQQWQMAAEQPPHEQ